MFPHITLCFVDGLGAAPPLRHSTAVDSTSTSLSSKPPVSLRSTSASPEPSGKASYREAARVVVPTVLPLRTLGSPLPGGMG